LQQTLHYLRAHRRNPLHGGEEGRAPGKIRAPEGAERIAPGMRKRPVSAAKLEAIVDETEAYLVDSPERERTTNQIGELIMNHLRTIDKVAYIRFASVYRDFKDVREFKEELEHLLNSREASKTVKR
jgi:transcriptional regulator NrdR family protein